MASPIIAISVLVLVLAIFDQGAEALDHMVAQLQNSDGVSQAMADTMNATLLGNLKLMGSYAQDAMIAVGLAMRDGLQAQDVGSVIIGRWKVLRRRFFVLPPAVRFRLSLLMRCPLRG